MATITNAVLTIVHNTNGTANVSVRCNVNFSALELNLMRTIPGTWFRLRCQLWGADSGLFGSDDHRFTFPNSIFFPDANPSPSEFRTFNAVLNDDVLNEDIGTDEIYAKLILNNLNTQVTISKKTNEVSHSF
jgi:hypothetical protein